jgi:hypothetical protein
MNEYRISLENGTTITGIYDSAILAVTAFDSPSTPVSQLVRIKEGITVGIPDTTVDITFRTAVQDAGAVTAGCKATPGTFLVADGTVVIFEATAGAGYNFLGWFIGEDTSGVAESTDLIAAIAIEAVIGVSADKIITALFAPV